MAVFGFGLVSYALFLVSVVYAIWFLLVGVDAGPSTPWWLAAGIDAVLLALFAVQHTVMARDAFKRRLTRLISPAAERSTFVLASSVCLLLLFTQWRPLPATIWSVSSEPWHGLLLAVYVAGWVFALGSTFMISHSDLFGLRQSLAAFRGTEYRPLPFMTRYGYAFVRHPLMTGFFIAFWATPHMTVGHALFAAAATGYILVGVWLEERDLVRDLGPVYERYRREVPAFVPLPRKRGRE